MTARPWWPGRSFTARFAITLAAVGVVAAGLTALAVNLVFQARFTSYVEDEQAERDERIVDTLAAVYEEAGEWRQADLNQAGVDQILQTGSIRLEDTGGRTVWSPPVRRAQEMMAEMENMAGMHGRMMGTDPLGPERDLPVRVDGELVGTAVVRSPEPGVLPADADFRSSVNRSLLLAGIGGALLAMVVGGLLARRATAPARRLTRAAQAFTGGDRAHRVTPDATWEFGQMGRAFNQMADTIAEEDRLRRAFAASVAHELRTPLAVLRSQVEALQDGVVEPSAKELASLHEEVLRLGGHVADLETIAATDTAGFTLERRQVELRPLLETTAHEVTAAFTAADVEFITDLAGTPVEVDGDPRRLRQVVRNLLANACAFTPEGGSVRLGLRAEEGWATIRVTDSGPGIPPEELPRVFDRFFRGRTATTGGSGIGLAVVRELVHAHGGTVEADSPPGQGATFTVRLPRAT